MKQMGEYQSTFSIPGISSQIDWGAMADKLLENARKPITLWTKQQDTLELKIGLFNEFSASMKTLRSAVTPLKLESIYKAKTAEFSSISGGDAAGILSATVDASAAIARHEIDVTRKAVAEARFSKQILGTMADEDPPLAAPAVFSVNVGGRRADITVQLTDTLSTIADKINTAKDATIDPATGQPYGEGLGVVATVLDGKLVIKSVGTGLGKTKSDWEITRGSTDTDLLGFTAMDAASPSAGNIAKIKDENGHVYPAHFTVLPGTDTIVWDTGEGPPSGVKYTVTYEVNSNALSLTGDNALLTFLGLDNSTLGDPNHRVAAQDAEFRIDGLLVTRSSNDVDDLLDGVKLRINGPGSVIMDITQDAEQAVTGAKDFVDAYNDVMDWINVRLSESTQKDANDDFSKKFGLLHGNSMLWQSKSQLRTMMTSSVIAKYTQKAGETIIGPLSNRGLSSPSTFELTVGVRTARIEVTPSDTLASIASKINSSYEMLHDPEGRTYPIPMASAKVVNNQLVIEASPGRKFSLAGDGGALEAVGLGTPFTLLSQLGITTESADYGKSGKLEFDQEKFMEALRKDPDGVAAIMTTVMSSMDDYIDGMVNTSQQQVGTATVPKGRIAGQIYAYQSEITSIDKRISDLERRLEVRARGLYESFARSEVRLAELQQQAQWLASVVTQLQGKS